MALGERDKQLLEELSKPSGSASGNRTLKDVRLVSKGFRDAFDTSISRVTIGTVPPPEAEDVAVLLTRTVCINTLRLTNYRDKFDSWAGVVSVIPMVSGLLTSLELQDNGMGLSGAKALAAHLPSMTKLKVLSLRLNCLSMVRPSCCLHLRVRHLNSLPNSSSAAHT